MGRSAVSRRLALISLLAIAMIVVPAVTSLPSGISGVKDTGCNCHGTEASPSVTASISGLPEAYNASETYTVTVSFTGGPSVDGNANLGGFNLWASAGTLANVDSSAQLWGPSEASHTTEGNDQRSWVLEWTAPDSGSEVKFILHTNSVNGNEGDSGSSGDMWDRAQVTVLGFGPEVLPD
ncbi:MAG: choice-of-anchor V domain-containing protein, partial [Candidatus Thermoplasmatota archaeon]|nr:choice-of-anchor V domain-containing protein [Candidatus Thermoplasmatota archaeon]